MTMWWVKYRVKASYSKGQWQWKPLYVETASRREARAVAVMAIEALGREHDWSEHYRGIDFSVHRTAPTNVVQTFLDWARDEARGARERAALLKLELERSKKRR